MNLDFPQQRAPLFLQEISTLAKCSNFSSIKATRCQSCNSSPLLEGGQCKYLTTGYASQALLGKKFRAIRTAPRNDILQRPNGDLISKAVSSCRSAGMVETFSPLSTCSLFLLQPVQLSPVQRGFGIRSSQSMTFTIKPTPPSMCK